MDIQQLRYFVSVARHLNFSKAAKELYIEQPGLSQAIARLEKELGFKLFYRDRRSVQLTPAGTIFLKEAVDIITKSEKAIEKARLAASDFSGSLKIGFLPSLGKILLPQWAASFRHKYPKVKVIMNLFTMATLQAALEEGEVDIGYTRSFACDSIDFEWRDIYTDTVSVVVYEDHPFAGKNSIELAELSGQDFVLLAPKEAPQWFRFLKQLLDKKGITPHIVGYARRIEGLLPMVRAGIGIAIVPSSNKTFDIPEIRFIEVNDENFRFQVVLAWKKANPNNLIPLFIDVVKELATAEQT